MMLSVQLILDFSDRVQLGQTLKSHFCVISPYYCCRSHGSFKQQDLPHVFCCFLSSTIAVVQLEFAVMYVSVLQTPESENLAMISVQLASKFLFTVGFHTKKTLRSALPCIISVSVAKAS